MTSQAKIDTGPSPKTGKTAFFLLDGDYYKSEAIFEREVERVFTRDWVYAGHISQLPKTGDYLMFTYGREEIVVVRGEGETVHANLNVCRHRGYRLCAEEKGHVRTFLCGYHKWSFNLDGSLRHVPQMPDGVYFDYCKYGLRTAKTEVWNGLMFVHLGEGPIESLRERFAALQPTASKFGIAKSKLAHEIKYSIAGNWKVAVENALECYHCASNHPSLCGVVDVPGLMADLKTWFADEDNKAANTLGASGMRVKTGMKTLSGDGSLISPKLMGELGPADAENGVTGGIMLAPNPFYAMIYVDHWWTIAIRPKSALETELVYSWYVREDAMEGEDYNVARLIEIGDNTQTEDNILIERTQRGINSRYFAPGPIGSDVEPALFDFVSNYKTFMD